jgi:hypothetical protein
MLNILKIIFLFLTVIKINSLYQFKNNITYGVLTNSLSVFSIDNGIANGTLYNDHLNIEILFVIKNNDLQSYPTDINHDEELIINDIVFFDINKKPKIIYYNRIKLNNLYWNYNEDEKKIYIRDLDHDAYEPLNIHFNFTF